MKRTREGVISLSELKYKRILLKVSGEALGEKTAQGDGFGLDFGKIGEVASAIKECVDEIFAFGDFSHLKHPLCWLQYSNNK